MKPRTSAAMSELIEQVRSTFPFDIPEENICDGICNGCSTKLLDYLDMQTSEWEVRLSHGEQPKLGDIEQLAKTSKKIYRVLEKNNLPLNPSKT